MKNLTTSEAVAFVRARLDEIAFSASDMLVSNKDDRNLETTILSLLPEAIKTVHLAAPVSLLEGLTLSDSDVTPELEGGYVVIPLEYATFDGLLRLVSFRDTVNGTGQNVTELTPEDSMLGRLQKNKYMRGTPENPVLVARNVPDAHRPELFYYGPADVSFSFIMEYIPLPVLKTAQVQQETVNYYLVAERVSDAILNLLTGMVLQAYREDEHAAVYIKKTEMEIQ